MMLILFRNWKKAELSNSVMTTGVFILPESFKGIVIFASILSNLEE